MIVYHARSAKRSRCFRGITPLPAARNLANQSPADRTITSGAIRFCQFVKKGAFSPDLS